jgi:hypothetical protein
MMDNTIPLARPQREDEWTTLARILSTSSPHKAVQVFPPFLAKDSWRCSDE